MKYVVYDTSAIYSASFLIKDKKLIKTILENKEFLETSFMTPQIVVDEMVNKLREEIEIRNKDYGDIKKKCLQILDKEGIEKILPGEKAINIALENELMENVEVTIKEIGKILPYPNVLHKDVVTRALNRKKPFDLRGENGYRDTLIWETIKELCATSLENTEIFFICQNPKDFYNLDKCKNKESELEDSLLGELDKIKFAKNKFKCYWTLTSFFDKEIVPSLEVIKEIKSYVLDNGFKKQMESYINDDLFEEKNFQDEINYSYDSMDINYIGLIQIVQVLETRKITKETVIMKIECEVEYSVSVYIYKSDYISDADVIGSVTDWNDSYFQKEINDCIYPELLITYDIEEEKILSVSKY